MSKTAVLFLAIAVCAFIGAMALPLDATLPSLILGALSVISSCLFLLAMVKGRKFKFDPQLR